MKSRKLKKKEVKKIAKYLANDYMNAPLTQNVSFDEVYKDFKNDVKKENAMVFDLSNGVYVVSVNIQKVETEENGLFHEKFVSQLFISNDGEVKDISDYDIIPSENYVDDEGAVFVIE